MSVVGGNMLGKMLMQMTHERLKSRSLSLRRVREVLMEMYVVCSRVFENFPYEYTFFCVLENRYKSDINVIRASGQMKPFRDLCLSVGICL